MFIGGFRDSCFRNSPIVARAVFEVFGGDKKRLGGVLTNGYANAVGMPRYLARPVVRDPFTPALSRHDRICAIDMEEEPMTPQQAEMICHIDVLRDMLRGIVGPGICIAALAIWALFWTNSR